MSTLQTRTRIWFCAAVASLVAMPAWADGELDTSFGTNGIVKIGFPNSSLGYLHDVALVSGAIEAAGFERETPIFGGCATPFPNLLVVRLSLGGTVIGSPGSYPQDAIQCPTALIVDSTTGDIYVIGGFSLTGFGSQGTAVARFDVAGALIATYAVTGGRYGGPFCHAARTLLDNGGRFFAACGVRGEFGVTQIAPLRLSVQNGQFAGGFLPQVYLSGYRTYRTVTAQDASSGAYYVSTDACRAADFSCPGGATTVTTQMVIRLNPDSGSLDTAYGSGGAATAFSAPGAEVNGIALDDSGNVLIVGDYAGTSSGYLARLDSTGTADATFGTNGVVQNASDAIVDVRTDHSSRVYALGSASELLRLKVNGARDTSFSSSSGVQTLNGPHSRWQSMQSGDSSNSSVYLLGGAVGCDSGCSNAATTAIIAKVTLVSNMGGPGNTTTVLNASGTTISSGQTVTLTVTVIGAHPTGSVTFKDGSTTLSTANLSTGSASYSTSALAVGSHDLTATYTGDSNNAASTSQAVTETVNPPPPPSTTALTSSATTITNGQSVTFTATVTGTKPTGTVTFKDGVATLGDPVNLNSASASFSTAALAVGSHSVVATYSGDSNNAASTSAAVTETVNVMPGSGSSGGNGGGGAITLIDLCAVFLLALWQLHLSASVGRFDVGSP